MEIAQFSFNMFGVNTYLIWDSISKECAVIDPGMIYNREYSVINNFISKNSLIIKMIVNTHLHIDHVFGNQFVKDKYGVEVYANEEDVFLGQRIKEQAEMFGLTIKISNVETINGIKHGDVVTLGNEEIDILHVPGHSPGSVALYCKNGGFVITGDALFQSSIGRTDLPGGNYQTLIKSIKEVLLTLPDDTVIYPGHGPSTNIKTEKMYNPFVH